MGLQKSLKSCIWKNKECPKMEDTNLENDTGKEFYGLAGSSSFFRILVWYFMKLSVTG